MRSGKEAEASGGSAVTRASDLRGFTVKQLGGGGKEYGQKAYLRRPRVVHADDMDIVAHSANPRKSSSAGLEISRPPACMTRKWLGLPGSPTDRNVSG